MGDKYDRNSSGRSFCNYHRNDACFSLESNSLSLEFVGILNSILLIGVGVFFSSLIGKIFGIKPEDIQKSIDQSVKASKEIGLEKTVQLHIDKLQASPNTDDENN